LWAGPSLVATRAWSQLLLDTAKQFATETILGRLLGGQPAPTPTVPTFRERLGPFVNAPAQAEQTLADLKAAQAAKEREQSLILELKLLQQRIEVLGESATLEEQYNKKRLELDAARIKSTEISTRDVQRGLSAFIYAQQQAQEATRERLGVATEQQIVDAKLAQIQFDLAKGIITVTEATKAEAIARKEAAEAAEALAVRTSRLPELTRFAIDASKGFKQFAQLAVTNCTNFDNAIADVAVGPTKLSDAFKKMIASILRDLIRLTIRMAVPGPLAGALQGLFGSITGPAAGITTGPTLAQA